MPASTPAKPDRTLRPSRAPVRAGAAGAAGSDEPAGAGPVERPAREHREIRVWLRLLSAATRIESILQSRINRDFGISLARFDLMAQLDRAPDGLTMTDASRRMMVTNAAVTSLVDRLVEEGFVSREGHAEDRRTVVIRLTAAGRTRFREIAARHEEWVVSLLSGLEPRQVDGLLDGLSALRTRLDTLDP